MLPFFASRDEGVTSIVYTDEGGQEQSLVGKIVYTTDESGTGNIIIQVVAVFKSGVLDSHCGSVKTESRGSGPLIQYCNSGFEITLKGRFFYVLYLFLFSSFFFTLDTC
jgi:hypothetical protein